MAAWKLAPVPAAGCCSVSKPSSDTSLSVFEFARLAQDVIPKGVINVITGSGSKSGQYMLDHKGFRKLAFTGSTEAVRQVADVYKRQAPDILGTGFLSLDFLLSVSCSIRHIPRYSTASAAGRTISILS